jgi:hypothetical protein
MIGASSAANAGKVCAGACAGGVPCIDEGATRAGPLGAPSSSIGPSDGVSLPPAGIVQGVCHAVGQEGSTGSAAELDASTQERTAAPMSAAEREVFGRRGLARSTAELQELAVSGLGKEWVRILSMGQAGLSLSYAERVALERTSAPMSVAELEAFGRQGLGRSAAELEAFGQRGLARSAAELQQLALSGLGKEQARILSMGQAGLSLSDSERAAMERTSAPMSAAEREAFGRQGLGRAAAEREAFGRQGLGRSAEELQELALSGLGVEWIRILSMGRGGLSLSSEERGAMARTIAPTSTAEVETLGPSAKDPSTSAFVVSQTPLRESAWPTLTRGIPGGLDLLANPGTRLPADDTGTGAHLTRLAGLAASRSSPVELTVENARTIVGLPVRDLLHGARPVLKTQMDKGPPPPPPPKGTISLEPLESLDWLLKGSALKKSPLPPPSLAPLPSFATEPPALADEALYPGKGINWYVEPRVVAIPDGHAFMTSANGFFASTDWGKTWASGREFKDWGCFGIIAPPDFPYKKTAVDVVGDADVKATRNTYTYDHPLLDNKALTVSGAYVFAVVVWGSGYFGGKNLGNHGVTIHMLRPPYNLDVSGACIWVPHGYDTYQKVAIDKPSLAVTETAGEVRVWVAFQTSESEESAAGKKYSWPRLGLQCVRVAPPNPTLSLLWDKPIYLQRLGEDWSRVRGGPRWSPPSAGVKKPSGGYKLASALPPDIVGVGRGNLVSTASGDVWGAYTDDNGDTLLYEGEGYRHIFAAKIPTDGDHRPRYWCIDRFLDTMVASQGHHEEHDPAISIDETAHIMVVAYSRPDGARRRITLAWTRMLDSGLDPNWTYIFASDRNLAAYGDETQPAIAASADSGAHAIAVTWFAPAKTGGSYMERVGRVFTVGTTLKPITPEFTLSEKPFQSRDRGVYEYQGLCSLPVTPGSAGPHWLSVSTEPPPGLQDLSKVGFRLWRTRW